MSASGSRKRPRRGGRDHDTASAGTVTPPSSPGSSRKRTRLLCESCPAITEYQYFLSHTGSGEPSQTNFGKPVYSLDEFFFFDKDITVGVALNHAEQSTTADSGLHAIGYIQPHWNCDEDEEGDGEHPSQLIDEPTFVRLSSVLRVQISLGYIDKQYGLNGSHIWIETTFAYYYLLDPAINYVHIFAQWFRHAKAAQTVVAAVCCNPKITKPHFLSRLSELEHDQRIGENPLGEEDFENAEVKRALVHELQQGHHEFLWRTVLQANSFILAALPLNFGHQVSRAAARRADLDTTTMQLQVTPRVFEYAKGILPSDWMQHIRVLGEQVDSDQQVVGEADLPWMRAPPQAKSRTIELAEKNPVGHYLQATVGDIDYHSGDVVLVWGKLDTRTPEWWVGRVAYFHKIKDKKMAHIEWFEPASVVLGKRSQVSSQYELFAINNCTDVPIHTLDGSPLPFRQDGLVHYNEAFCNFLFTGSAFVRLASYDRLHVSGRCALCPIQAAGDDFPYHHGDIVLLSTGGDWEARISVIAQLIIRRRTRSFRKLIRRGADSCFGERLLELPQDVEELPLYDTDLVVGRCHIRVGTPTFDECVADPLLFFVNEFSSIVLCEQCLTGDDAARLEQERLDLMFVNHPHLKLKLLDAYCGAGGLSLGLEQGGRCIEPTLAFDHEPVAAQTYAKNTPTATVCVANSGSVLKTCVTGADGANVLGHRHIPKEIDIIAAGCPCQGHSGLNQHRGNLQATHNNLQVLTALSFVEHFKPRYFVFENVPGILGWNLPSQSADNNEGCRGLHLIIGVLLHLRYQVRTFKLLASQYGAPQKRQRLFIIAARMELPLPAAPHPLFSMPKGSEKMQTKHVKVCNAVSAEQPQWPVQSFDDLTPAHVPHAYYSLEAAIGDLHHFNWAKDEFADKAVITANRINRPTIYAPSAASVYPATTLKPLSEFQLRIRHSGHHDVPTISSLRHYTAGISQRSMNNVVAAVEGTSQRHYDRPRYDDQFRTLVTNFNPDALQVGVLHPTQTRIFTFRETLRGQGYPDWFSFPPDIRPRELYKLIGNSVPIPLGEAIGREIANSWINYLRSEGQIDLDGAEDSREGSVEAS